MPVVKDVAVLVFAVCDTVVSAGAEKGSWQNRNSKSNPFMFPGADTATVIYP